MTWDWNYAAEIAPALVRATTVTIEATIGGMLLAAVLGLLLAVGRMSSIRPLSVLVTTFIEFIRGTPLLIQLFVLFYVLPRYGLAFDALLTGIIGLGVNYSAYTAEVYRAGIQSIPRGQWEAATALNISSYRTWRDVILPQAIPPVIPPLGNYLISMFKDTPLLFTITVPELLGVALGSANESFRYLEPLTIVGLIFLALSLPSVWIVSSMERRLKVVQ